MLIDTVYSGIQLTRSHINNSATQKMNKIISFIKPVAGILAVAALIYFFPDIFLYFAIAIILSMLGRPLCERLKKIHVKKFYLGDTVSAVITMLALFLIFSLVFILIIPLVNRELAVLSSIDTKAVIDYFDRPIEKVYNILIQYNIIRPEEDILKMVEMKLYSIINWDNFSNVVGGFISKTSSLVVGSFSTVFLTFFLLKEHNIVHNILMAITPDNQTMRMNNILHDSRIMLTRYMFGLIAELLCMMILIFLGLTAFGVKNALIIAIIGGFMNIVPYLGPLMCLRSGGRARRPGAPLRPKPPCRGTADLPPAPRSCPCTPASRRASAPYTAAGSGRPRCGPASTGIGASCGWRSGAPAWS